MYCNVPTDELIKIIDSMCIKQGINDKLSQHPFHHNKTELFQFLNTFYTQETGHAMGAPTSSIFSEIYMQNVKNTAIYDILVNNNIHGYFRYVDDILIVYNTSITNIHDVFNSFNNLMPTMKFTMEKEIDNKINFLDVTIQKETDSLFFNVYRKPTTTDTSFRTTPVTHKNTNMQL
jgi:hypothetical protein